MADTYTTRNRFEKMEPGAYLDTWASRANGQFGSDLIDESLDGVVSLTVSGSVALTTANGSTDQARKRILVCTGTGGSIGLPSKEKWYIIKNGCSGDVSVGASGSTATLKTGTVSFVYVDSGNNCYQMIRSDFEAMNILTTGSVSCGGLTTTGNSALGDSGSADSHVVKGYTTIDTAGRTDGNNFKVYGDQSFGSVQVNFAGGSYQDIAFSALVNRAANTAYDFHRCQSSYGGSNDAEFRVRGDGTVFSDAGTAMSTPADYADMMEWLDGNPDREDRIGYSVVVEEGRVRKASADDDSHAVIGIASGNPSICGGSGWNRWVGKFLTDDFNRQILTEDGDRILNPNFDPEHEYTPRSERPEWDPIGLVGRIPLRKGCPVNPRWIKLRDISHSVEEWLVR